MSQKEGWIASCLKSNNFWEKYKFRDINLMLYLSTLQ